MAKRKGTADLLRTFLAKPGATKQQAAAALNRSVRTVERVLKGDTKGERLREGAAELARRSPRGGRPIALANAPEPPRSRQNVPIPVGPGVDRVYLGGGRRETRYQGEPSTARIRAELRGVYEAQVQLRVTFKDGTTATIWKKGGYDAIKARKLLEGEPDGPSIGDLLADIDYDAEEHGGVESVSVVYL